MNVAAAARNITVVACPCHLVFELAIRTAVQTVSGEVSQVKPLLTDCAVKVSVAGATDALDCTGVAHHNYHRVNLIVVI